MEEQLNFTQEVGLESGPFTDVGIHDAITKETHKTGSSSNLRSAVVSIEGADEYLVLDASGGNYRVFRSSETNESIDEFPAIRLPAGA
ncbi:hypothetical protein [Gimesia maris]|jgi:hypothetical protein|uniref:hypothetical protein n=1 Tax=Gimesia maris TaxID=122 RepID=UPI0030DC633D|tara:strand:- start:33 stop:296 length:264 start_codon:yes stop_codon:yes gene_type:complete